MAHEPFETPEESAAAAPADLTESSVDPAELQRQRDDYYDRLLRKTAEFDNYRKRVDRERVQLAEAAAADLLEELLPLVDDMERALKADPGTEATEEELIGYCGEHLAKFKCPTSVDIIDALPRNPAGKVLKTKLRERFGAEKQIDAGESSTPPTVSAGAQDI